MKCFHRTACGVLLSTALLTSLSGCGQSKAPPPGAPTDTNAVPTVDLGAQSGGPNEGAAMDPTQTGAGVIAREPGITGEGQAPEEQRPNTGSP